MGFGVFVAIGLTVLIVAAESSTKNPTPTLGTHSEL